MATVVTLTATFVDGSNEAITSGHVTFQLVTEAQIPGSDLVVGATPVHCSLNAFGELVSPQGVVGCPLIANDSASIMPGGTNYVVTESFLGSFINQYTITINSSMAPTVDLSTLTKGQSSSGGSVSSGVSSVNGRTGAVTLGESDISGLGSDLAARLVATNNLADVVTPSVARTNLGVQALYTATATQTSNYTASAWQMVPCDASAGSFSVTLPTAPSNGTNVAVKLLATTGTNTVTVTTGGSDVINVPGVTTATLQLASESFELIYNGAGKWFIVGGQKSLASLDGRYLSATGNDTLVGQILKVGPTSYPYTAAGAQSAYLIADKVTSANDASFVMRDGGAIKGEVGLAADDNLHVKAVTGAAGSETFTDAIIVENSTAYVYVPQQLGVGTVPAALLHAAGSSTGGRISAKIENTNTAASTSAGAQVEFKGNSAAVDWLFGTDYGENSGNNFFVQDSNNGLRFFIDGSGRAVHGDFAATTAANNSIEAVGSVKTRGTNGMSALNFCGISSAIGAPTASTWSVGDAIIDSLGNWWICTTAGTPGTWSSPTARAQYQDQLSALAMGAVAATCDGGMAPGTPGITTGRPYFVLAHIASNQSISKMDIDVISSGASTTLSNTYMGVYDVASGNLLGQTADFSSSIPSGSGTLLLHVSLTSTIAAQAIGRPVYLAFLTTLSGTSPTLTVVGMRQFGSNQSAASPTGRLFVNSSGSTLTSLPSTVPSLTQTNGYSLPFLAAYNV